MGARVMERRQYRRIDLEVPVEVHSLDPEDAPVGILTGRARNVSLAGCFAIMPAPFALPSGTNVSCTVSVPPESTKQFPFVRLIAKGWVVRLEPLNDPAEVGVAIAFTSDVTALTTIGAA